ncbi:glutamine synthetase family protein [Rhodococcus wratislaviensis]|uniref:glutamine synthetase family protein n=1 Tax=Rhodococcus wratislaviensis TaxID=44752 RepID=UPI003663F4F2
MPETTLTPTTSQDLPNWLKKNTIRSVRVEGTNLDGALMGKVLSPNKATGALSSGVGFADLAFDADLGNTPRFGYALQSWRGDLLDVILKPDPTTIVEWRPGQASILGSFEDRDGNPLPVCPRSLLQRVCAQSKQAGYLPKIAIEIEASIFEESVQEARIKGFRNLTPLGGSAGFAYHMPKDRQWHEYMEAVADRLDSIGVPWECLNDEAAAGQIEINLAVSDPLTACDHWTRTRQVMREVAFDLGRTVTFMAKWCDEYGQASHINLSLWDENGANAFYAADGPSATLNSFMGGVMQTLAGTTSLALPWITSYRRITDFEGPPTTVTWGLSNKFTAVRAITGHATQSRIEYRVPGSDSNCYLVAAAVLASGLHGMANALQPPQPFEGITYGLPDGVVDHLPDTISKASALLADDTLLRSLLGQDLIDHWLGNKKWEWMMFHQYGGSPSDPITDWELTRYFELV